MGDLGWTAGFFIKAFFFLGCLGTVAGGRSIMAKRRDIIEHYLCLEVALFSGEAKISGYLHVMIGDAEMRRCRSQMGQRGRTEQRTPAVGGFRSGKIRESIISN
jgi:hypothetical protein